MTRPDRFSLITHMDEDDAEDRRNHAEDVRNYPEMFDIHPTEEL